MSQLDAPKISSITSVLFDLCVEERIDHAAKPDVAPLDVSAESFIAALANREPSAIAHFASTSRKFGGGKSGAYVLPMIGPFVVEILSACICKDYMTEESVASVCRALEKCINDQEGYHSPFVEEYMRRLLPVMEHLASAYFIDDAPSSSPPFAPSSPSYAPASPAYAPSTPSDVPATPKHRTRTMRASNAVEPKRVLRKRTHHDA